MARPKLTKTKEAITIYLKEELLDKLIEYCKENGIENYSDYIETIIKKNIENKK